MERRKPKVQLGRRRTDVPLKILEDFKNEMQAHVAETIRVTVNGKLDDLKHTSLTKEEFKIYVDNDMAWKADNEPALDNMRNLTGLSKLVIGLIVTVGALLAGLQSIRGFWQK